MAEILVKAIDATLADPIKDQQGSYKRGMPVVVMPDGHQWGTGEGLPTFFLLKLPGVPVEKVAAFLAPITDAEGNPVRRRLWQLQWASLPAAARTKLTSTGVLTIAPSGGDYTWAQVRAYLTRFDTGAQAPATL